MGAIPSHALFGTNLSSSTPKTEGSSGSGPSTGRSPSLGHIMFVPEMEEVRVSAIVSKRGYLNLLEQKIKVNFEKWLNFQYHTSYTYNRD